MKPTLTIGMATYQDFEGVWMTIRVLRTFHNIPGRAIELLVIDNAPTACKQTEAVTLAAGGRYFHRPDLVGTSAPRDHLFRIARADWVMCVDSHIILEPGAVAAAIAYAEAHPDSLDIVQGPLVHDDGKGISTHWRPTTAPGLWGTWDVDPRYKLGEPFEIPMQGLGMWMMRKDAWPGFNPAFRGFGGEEGYIHEKTRQRGGKAICLPALRWQHRFRAMNSGGKAPGYPLRLEDHVRNLLIGHRELGINAVNAIYQDFGRKLPADAWERLRGESLTFERDKHADRPAPLRLLGIWYSNNAAPLPLLQNSLATIRRAGESSRHAVEVQTCSWNPIGGNPFPWTQAELRGRKGHAAILRQMEQAIGNRRDSAALADAGYDAIVYLEHDVLYPPNYFDRIGDAFALNPSAPVVSNLDYIGLNETGWLGVKERHEPLHQLAIRWDFARENDERAKEEVIRTGSCLLEPQGDRSAWVRLPAGGTMPSVHVNHPHRLTSHGEVCYERTSSLKPSHAFWGDYKVWWPLPAAPAKAKAAPGCGTCGGPPAPADYPSLEAWFAAAAAKPSDFHEHMPTLRTLADKCESVAEISLWAVKPALLALAASKSPKVTSYCPMVKPEYAQITKHAGERFRHVQSIAAEQVEPADLVYIDTKHNAETLYPELAALHEKARRYLVIHCTTTYGDKGDDGKVGVLPAIRRFLREHTEWTAIRSDKNNHGLMVLSKDDADKHAPPSLIRKALNFTKASAKHAADGMKLVSDEVYEERINTCMTCEHRHYDSCGACGCPVEKKASWASEECGLVKLGLPPKWTANVESTPQS